MPQRLHYWHCQFPGCGHVFAAPVPDEDTLLNFYAAYTTHAQGPANGQRSALARWASRRRQQALLAALPTPTQGQCCLDYGCGNGDLMRLLSQAGWNPVGYEPDPQARAVALNQGHRVHEQPSHALAEGPFDLIVLHHVLEHLPDPQDSLLSLARMLRPGGRLAIWTPNAGSLLAHCFGSAWRGWETPRHLHIFTAASLGQLARRLEAHELQVEALGSSNQMFLGIYHPSMAIRLRCLPAWLNRVVRHALSPFLWAMAQCTQCVAALVGHHTGEELRLILRRRQ